MDTLGVTQKNMRTNIEVTVMEVGTRKGGRILEFCAAMNMTVGNILFKRRASLLIIYESGPLRKLRSIIVWSVWSGETNESSC